MRLKSLLWCRLLIGWAACFVLCLPCFGYLVVEQVPAVPHAWTVPGSIHIKYSFTRIQPPLPKEFLDAHIAELNEKIKQAGKSPGGRGVAFTNSAFKKDWEKRYVASPPECGQAEYWGTKSGMIWSNGQTAYAYNGVYNTSAHPGDLFPSLFGSKARPEWLHVTSGTDGLDFVPYLGFVQPGKDLFSAGKPVIKNTASGFEERRDVNDKIRGTSFTLLAKYNVPDRLVSITKQFADLVPERTEFSDYTNVGRDFYYPRNVKVTTYLLYMNGKKMRSSPETIVVYKALSVDTKPINPSLFDANYPRVGVVVQDFRYKSKSRPYGVQYKYANNRLTVAQASAMAARQQAAKAGNGTNWLVTAIRLICLAVVFLLIGRAVLAFIRKRSAQE